MTWDDFGPYVLPYAPGCPDATMEHHARLAAIEFCRYTNVWRQALASLTGTGTTTLFTMTRPTDAEVSKLLGVAITDAFLNVVDAAVLTPMYGEQLVRDATGDTIAFTDDLRTLTVWPAQAVDAVIVPTVVLKPSMTAATFPDDLFAHYAQDIAAGALATILSMPKNDWTDMPAAAIRAAEFNAKKAAAARKVERGFAKSGRRSALRWF